MVKLRHPAIEHLRLLLHERPDEIRVAKSDGREDVMTRPAFDEQSKNIHVDATR